MRAAIESVFRESLESGGRTIVLRAGDFVEGRRSGNWFENHVGGGLGVGRVTCPGPLDRAHAWAWLPDLATVAAAPAEARARLQPFEAVGFPGRNLTGHELVTALERVSARSLTVRSMPWWALRLAVSDETSGVVRRASCRASRYSWRCRPVSCSG